ncbi:DoxX family protein [Rhabdothermincola salaria]|uniref:DoxX family protein n=1 Tax=Rhabdothermincola salaria TaxID=2903142 RepID=UPI001E328B67|nr:DoxX family protein [Rhabdothermincola salaria]
MKPLCATLSRLRPAAPIILRVILGGLFVWHGVDKFQSGIDMVESMFDMWGVPLPGLAAPLVAVVEIVGGIALILGLMTRASAMVLSVVMIGALVYVKGDVGLIPMDAAGAEVDLAYLGGLLALVALGPGPLSVDMAMGIEADDLRPATTPSERTAVSV